VSIWVQVLMMLDSVDRRNEAPWPLVMPGHTGSTKPMPAHWTAALKLPNRRRIVFSDGLMPAWVHEAAVGEVPRSATKRRTASSAWSEARLPLEPNRRRRPPIQRCSSCVWLGPPGRALTLRGISLVAAAS
jgi:hypothetical protein